MLRRLGQLGFAHVVATPHMRPGLFDNRKEHLTKRFREVGAELAGYADLPQRSLGSEHFFDEAILGALREREGLPYADSGELDAPRERGAVLVEFHDLASSRTIEQQLFEIQRWGYLPVIAHPERYRAVWSDPSCLERLLDLGSVALLDVAAVVGKYGREPQRSARRLLELGLYDAACSDAHRPDDVTQVAAGMSWIEAEHGREELEFLLGHAPAALLAGRRPE